MSSFTSLQEAALAFANNITAQLNSVAAEVVGIDVMWFRAIPDKRNEDVIFQSYTLFGVEDCPLRFKAVYSDTGYDDAAITYNIMGLEYSVPLTLEIPIKTWYEITNHDGTIPQRGDIVFIPLSNKLVEVVSMTPVKAIAAQITSYKVNCSIYKPTRSRIVGENLRTSIEENTVNLRSQFGEDIVNTFENVVDDDQLSLFNSTSRDKHKEITGVTTPDTLISDKEILNVMSEDLEIDGHIVSRSHYDMELSEDVVVTYNRKDTLEPSSERCYSAWVNIKDCGEYKNIKRIKASKDENGSYIEILEYSGKRMEAGEKVVLERGNIVICGEIDDSEQYRIKVHPTLFGSLNKSVKDWENLTGYIIRKDNVINLLYGHGDAYDFSIDMQANNYIVFSFGESRVLCQLPIKLKTNRWYGLVLNIGSELSIDVFDGNGELKKACGIPSIKNRNDLTNNIEHYYIKSSPSLLTNIRLYDVSNRDLDKQIIDLVSYNTPYNSHAIINDTADQYLRKTYMAKQR